MSFLRELDLEEIERSLSMVETRETLQRDTTDQLRASSVMHGRDERENNICLYEES